MQDAAKFQTMVIDLVAPSFPCALRCRHHWCSGPNAQMGVGVEKPSGCVRCPGGLQGSPAVSAVRTWVESYYSSLPSLPTRGKDEAGGDLRPVLGAGRKSHRGQRRAPRRVDLPRGEWSGRPRTPDHSPSTETILPAIGRIHWCGEHVWNSANRTTLQPAPELRRARPPRSDRENRPLAVPMRCCKVKVKAAQEILLTPEAGMIELMILVVNELATAPSWSYK